MSKSLPAKLRTNSFVVAQQKRIKSSAQKLREMRAQADDPMSTAKDGAVVLGFSALAGALDTQLPSIPLGEDGIPASAGLGIAAAAVGIATGNQLAIKASVGFLAPHAYMQGAQAATKLSVRLSA